MIGTWVLIILLNGWGAGAGSTGNAATGVYFNSWKACDAAQHRMPLRDGVHAFCVPTK